MSAVLYYYLNIMP